MKKVLVVDDELGIRSLLSEILEDDGYAVVTAEDATQCRQVLNRERVDLILLDIWMPDTDGVTLLKELCAQKALYCPVIMMSGHGTIQTAIEATRFGAVDYLEKPIALKKLLETCAAAIKSWDYNSDDPLSEVAKNNAAKLTARMNEGNPTPVHRPAHAVTVGGNSHCHFRISKPYEENPCMIYLDGYDITEDPTAALPVFEIKSLNLTIDFNKPYREFRDDMERAYLALTLTQKDGSVIELARQSQLERTHLYRKLRSLGLDPSTCNHQTARETGLCTKGSPNLKTTETSSES